MHWLARWRGLEWAPIFGSMWVFLILILLAQMGIITFLVTPIRNFVLYLLGFY